MMCGSTTSKQASNVTTHEPHEPPQSQPHSPTHAPDHTRYPGHTRRHKPPLHTTHPAHARWNGGGDVRDGEGNGAQAGEQRGSSSPWRGTLPVAQGLLKVLLLNFGVGGGSFAPDFAPRKGLPAWSARRCCARGNEWSCLTVNLGAPKHRRRPSRRVSSKKSPCTACRCGI
jgi:hypothetical protein